MTFTLRKPESEEKYQEEKKNITSCPFCEKKHIHQWEHWKLMPNQYPYDLVAEKHDLLVLNSHNSVPSEEEKKQLDSIKKMKFMNDYHCIIENLPQRQSISGHFHVHLMRYIP